MTMNRNRRHWLFGSPSGMRFFADGDGDGGGGGGGGETPDWHGDFPCLANNPEASKAMSKYADPDAAMSAAVDAQKKVGRAFWLPDDHSKLTETQKGEIRANVATMDGGVPDTADGYKLAIPEGTKCQIDEAGIANYKVFAKSKNMTQALAQEGLSFQLATTDRNNALAEEALVNNAIETKKQFAKDCGGEAESVLRMQWIKEYLQSKCMGPDGAPDTKMWESFEPFFDKKGMEIVFLRALAEPAKAARGTGGGAGPGSAAIVPGGDQEYAEMRGKK